MQGYCIVCNKKLRKIGPDRKNGSLNHKDWDTRKTHYHLYVAERLNKDLEKLALKFYADKYVGVEVEFLDDV